jgi:hypothetical protein
MQILSVQLIPTTPERMREGETILRSFKKLGAGNHPLIDYMHQQWLQSQNLLAQCKPVLMDSPLRKDLAEKYDRAKSGTDTCCPLEMPEIRKLGPLPPPKGDNKDLSPH